MKLAEIYLKQPLIGSEDLDFKIKINKLYIKLLKDYKDKQIKYSFDEIVELFGDKFNKNKVLNGALTLSSSVYSVNGKSLMRNFRTFNFIK